MLEFLVPLAVVGLAALSILAVVTPPPMASFRRWLGNHQIDIDDHTCALAQVALLKACLVAVVAVVIGTSLGFLMELALPIGTRLGLRLGARTGDRRWGRDVSGQLSRFADAPG